MLKAIERNQNGKAERQYLYNNLTDSFHSITENEEDRSYNFDEVVNNSNFMIIAIGEKNEEYLQRIYSSQRGVYNH